MNILFGIIFHTILLLIKKLASPPKKCGNEPMLMGLTGLNHLLHHPAEIGLTEQYNGPLRSSVASVWWQSFASLGQGTEGCVCSESVSITVLFVP